MPDQDRNRSRDWNTDENYWRENYRTRPYADDSRDFDHYRPAYKYGYESADRVGNRSWDEAEPELRSGWDRYEGRGQSKWDDVKDSVRDAWNRVTGRD
jgi:hypothetical protein